MEALCGLEVALLWAGIIGLANLPEDITEPSTKAPEHHVIIVSCTHSRRFHGPEIISNTQHCHGGDTLHVTVFNKHFENKSTTCEVAPLLNDKAVTGFLVFLLILTSAAVLQVIYKMYVQKHVHKLRTSREVNEDTTFQSAASPTSLKTLLLSAGIICQITTTAGQWITASSPLQCSYTVTPITFGLQIDITSSTPGHYTLNINEEGRPGTGRPITVQHSNQKSSHEIKYLKPCTDYEHSVTYRDRAGEEKTCSYTENKTRTTAISKDDIKDVSCLPGHVCYRSDWDISSSLSTPNRNPSVRCDDKTFCVKPGYDDICSDFTTSFTSENSLNVSFSGTTSIHVAALTLTGVVVLIITIIIIIIIIISTVYKICKLRHSSSRNDVNRDVMLETTATLYWTAG